MKRDKELERYAEDAILGRPYAFSVSSKKGKKAKRFYLYPMTLGKMILVQHHIEALEINQSLLKTNMYVETMRLANEKKDDCLAIIGYHTCKGKNEALDVDFVKNRIRLLKAELSDEDIATLMVVALSSDKTSALSKYLGIDDEQRKMNEVMSVKDDRNSMTFGAKTQYGALIDAACERYGWSKDYVVWTIDFTSLKLMLSDKVVSIFLSDEEIKKLPARLTEKDTIEASKETMDMIRRMDWR